MVQAQVSFVNDIAPMLSKYRGEMAWRFDLANYDDVKANAFVINEFISQKMMPPPPYPPFSAEFLMAFANWMNSGYAR
jgi:hypothetical protein